MPPPQIPHSRPWITDVDRAAVSEVLASGMLAEGTRTRAFEAMIADRVAAAGAVALSSGTSALQLALLGLDVGKGDEVVVPTYTCQSVADAVRAVGATPVYCDVDDWWLMSAATVDAVLTPRTRAIILVHIFGIFADAQQFAAFGIPVIEDACQAFDGTRPRAASGFTVFSFHATKCLTTGEGGAVVAADRNGLEKLSALRQGNAVTARLSDLQAGLGISQLSRYDEFLRLRRVQAERYLAGLPVDLTQKVSAVRDRSMFFRFPLRVEERAHRFETARDFFGEAGIAVRRGVDTLLHRGAGLRDEAFPGAVRCFEETVSIPLRPGLTDDEQERILTRVGEYVGR